MNVVIINGWNRQRQRMCVKFTQVTVRLLSDNYASFWHFVRQFFEQKSDQTQLKRVTKIRPSPTRPNLTNGLTNPRQSTYVTASILISLQRTYVYKSFLLICTVYLSTVFGRRQSTFVTVSHTLRTPSIFVFLFAF